MTFRLEVCPICGKPIQWRNMGFAQVPECDCDLCSNCGLPEGQCACNVEQSIEGRDLTLNSSKEAE